ncbi:hypothetical protein [Streptomyces sp. CBMA123]|uniref:hypothetical protein n=1 Tax=Streptomyces sp. CBMA123 TaxID=1896313 RepID=UPI001661F332|nr:hypothetical protein [Streptomyces sp. CBMA123]MBD0692684.1 hypothetical protein [Streptomyces sp. CBMA123]
MASIVVLFELDADQAPPAVLMVHAAGADPDAPEDPQDRTLCGRDTTPMEHSHYRPEGPGEPWYPIYLRDRRCAACEEVLRRV